MGVSTASGGQICPDSSGWTRPATRRWRNGPPKIGRVRTPRSPVPRRARPGLLRRRLARRGPRRAGSRAASRSAGGDSPPADCRGLMAVVDPLPELASVYWRPLVTDRGLVRERSDVDAERRRPHGSADHRRGGAGVGQPGDSAGRPGPVGARLGDPRAVCGPRRERGPPATGGSGRGGARCTRAAGRPGRPRCARAARPDRARARAGWARDVAGRRGRRAPGQARGAIASTATASKSPTRRCPEATGSRTCCWPFALMRPALRPSPTWRSRERRGGCAAGSVSPRARPRGRCGGCAQRVRRAGRRALRHADRGPFGAPAPEMFVPRANDPPGRSADHARHDPPDQIIKARARRRSTARVPAPRRRAGSPLPAGAASAGGPVAGGFGALRAPQTRFRLTTRPRRDAEVLVRTSRRATL